MNTPLISPNLACNTPVETLIIQLIIERMMMITKPDKSYSGNTR